MCSAYDPIIWGGAAEPPKLHFRPRPEGADRLLFRMEKDKTDQEV